MDISISIFNCNLSCFHLIYRVCDPSDIELVNTEVMLQIIHYIRYNTINFRIYLSRRHSDCNVTAESYISYDVLSESSIVIPVLSFA